MTPPTHDVAAEEAVIASCLVDADAVARCGATGITAADFWTTFARYTYGAIRAVAGKHGADAVNRVTVGYELAQRPADDGTERTQIAVVGLAWLSRIEEELPTSIGAEWYARIVVECAQRRRAIVAAEQVAAAARAGASDVASRAAAVFNGIAGLPGPHVSSSLAPPSLPTPPSTTAIVSGALELL